MRKFLTIVAAVLLVCAFTACGNTTADKNAASAPAEKAAASKVLVAYFSCTGNTKAVAEEIATGLNADLYEIRPQVPYTTEDLNYNDETTRATVEQKDDNARPALADTNADIKSHAMVILAYPIWWGQAPRIMDTFVESYDFSGKVIVPVCTSGGSDLGSSADYLKTLTKGQADWRSGKQFYGRASKEEIKDWVKGVAVP